MVPGVEPVQHGFVRNPNGVFDTIDAPGAAQNNGFAGLIGDGGTMVFGIDLNGTITGQFQDDSEIFHGFVSDPPYTTFETIDIAGHGTAFLSGSNASCINDSGTIAGQVSNDGFFVFSYIRQPNGDITTFEVPGAGTGNVQGTFIEQPGACINNVGAMAGFYVDASLWSSRLRAQSQRRYHDL